MIKKVKSFDPKIKIKSKFLTFILSHQKRYLILIQQI